MLTLPKRSKRAAAPKIDAAADEKSVAEEDEEGAYALLLAAASPTRVLFLGGRAEML